MSLSSQNWVLIALSISAGAAATNASLVLWRRKLDRTTSARTSNDSGAKLAASTSAAIRTLVVGFLSSALVLAIPLFQQGRVFQASNTAPVLMIFSPQDRATVSIRVEVAGVATNSPSGTEIWVLIRAEAEPRLYPSGPCSFNASEWVCSPIQLGGQLSGGETFRIMAVFADARAQSLLRASLSDPSESLVALPTGIMLGDQVVVRRS